jgi:pimeloyl-ACP methyl ester carboxylesterase
MKLSYVFVALYVVLLCASSMLVRYPPPFAWNIPYTQWNSKSRIKHAKVDSEAIVNRLTSRGLVIVASSDTDMRIRGPSTITGHVSDIVVFVHGLGGSRAEFADYVPLVMKGHPNRMAVLLDLPSCGQRKDEGGLDWGLCHHEYIRTFLIELRESYSSSAKDDAIQPSIILVGMSAGAVSVINAIYGRDSTTTTTTTTTTNRGRGSLCKLVVALAPYSTLQRVIGDKLKSRGWLWWIADDDDAFLGWFLSIVARLSISCYKQQFPLTGIEPLDDLQFHPPLLLVHGSEDMLIRHHHSVTINAMIHDRSGSSSLCTVSGAHHVRDQLLYGACKQRILDAINTNYCTLDIFLIFKQSFRFFFINDLDTSLINAYLRF